MKNRDKKTRSRKAPTLQNGTVPPKLQPYAGRRPREYLTPKEVERLCKSGRRYGLRDATMILVTYRHRGRLLSRSPHPRTTSCDACSDGVGRLALGILEWQRPHLPQRHHGDQPCSVMARTISALLTVGQDGSSPSWLALWCW